MVYSYAAGTLACSNIELNRCIGRDRGSHTGTGDHSKAAVTSRRRCGSGLLLLLCCQCPSRFIGCRGSQRSMTERDGVLQTRTCGGDGSDALAVHLSHHQRNDSGAHFRIVSTRVWMLLGWGYRPALFISWRASSFDQ